MILSIIIPVFNVEKFVEKCVRSCLNQNVELSSYEIIIVNDGSTDSSLSIVENLAKEYNNIHVISQVNGGLSCARNTGMKYSSGDYYMFVDSDDWIKKNCLGVIIEKLEKEKPDCLAISFCRSTGSDCIKPKFQDSEEIISGSDYIRLGNPDPVQFAIWSSSFLDRHNLSFVHGILHEDAEFSLKAYYFADKVSRLKTLVYYHYINPNSITGTINYKRAFDYIEYACSNNSKFSESVDKYTRPYFDNKISIWFNNAHNICKDAPQKVIENFNQIVYDHRFLFKHLGRNGKNKYRAQYFLLKIWPHNSIQIYKFLKLFGGK